MPKPLDPDKRTAIADAIRNNDGERSRNQLARAFGVSGSTIARIAEQDGIDGAWDRTKTVNATRARSVDLAAERAKLQERWAVKANEALDRSEQECVVYSFGGQFNEYAEHTLSRPPAGEYRSFVTAAAVATDKLVALAKFDAADDGVEGAVSVIENLMGALRGQVSSVNEGD